MAGPLTGKTAVVTGSNSGIGKMTALELAKAGATVVMVCRPGDKSEAAYSEIAAVVGDYGVELMTADLSSQASIRACATEFKRTHKKLDILVNNAGVFLPDRQVTVDGLERTFAINHLAYFLFTNLVLDLLKASLPARIICVASEAERTGKIDFKDLQGEKRYSGLKAYSQSKIANILFTYELARRLAGTGVTANCLHPGGVNTGWGRNAKGLLRMGITLFRRFLLTPEQGAQTSIYLASSAEVEGITGGYFIKCKPVRSISSSYDLDLADKLWDVSEKLTGLSQTD
jgi:NAD(P)-dependent dehydrogenase (short-subunit alcohol dehydrogenase family)